MTHSSLVLIVRWKSDAHFHICWKKQWTPFDLNGKKSDSDHPLAFHEHCFLFQKTHGRVRCFLLGGAPWMCLYQHLVTWPHSNPCIMLGLTLCWFTSCILGAELENSLGKYALESVSRELYVDLSQWKAMKLPQMSQVLRQCPALELS